MSDAENPGHAEDAMVRLEAALSTWDSQLRDMHDHIAAQLSRAHERLDRLLDSESSGSASLLHQRENEIEVIQTRLNEAERAVADTRARAESLRTECERFSNEAQSLRVNFDSAQEEVNSLREENARLAASRDATISERDDAIAKRDIAISERDAAISERDAARAECARISEEFENARAQWGAQSSSGTEEELEEARLRLEEHARQHGAAAMERDRLRDELEQLRARHTHVCGQKQEVEAECVILRRRVRELEEAAEPSTETGPPSEKPAQEAAETEPQTEPAQKQPETEFRPMAFTSAGVKKKLGEILVDAGVISQDQLSEVLGKQSQAGRRRLGAILVEHGYTNEEAVARAFAAQIQMPFTALTDDEVDPKAAALLPAKIAHMHHCVPIREEDGLLSVAMSNPLDLVAIEDIELATKCLVFPLVATHAAIDFVATRFCK
jgi:hypothetical protein